MPKRFGETQLGTTLGILGLVVVSICSGCGSRPNLGTSGPSVVKVHLTAGTPIEGATVTIYAYNETGHVFTEVGQNGVIGIGGPTDANGDATVTLVALNMGYYSGPLQVVASGSNLSYVDPLYAALKKNDAENPIGAIPQNIIQIPTDMVFSSIYINYAAGTTVTIPVNLLTTLADHEVIAYARGLHPLHPGAKPLAIAVAERDPLFVKHLVNSENAWNSANLRTTVPADLGSEARTLDATAYAALFDYAMSALSHKTATAAGFLEGSTAINAFTLTKLLIQDVDADGVFDGRGEGGVQLSTQGNTPIALNSQFLRVPLAEALDQWIQLKNGNASGITQTDLDNSGVYQAISQDQSDLFGDAPKGLFNPMDRAAPEIAFVAEPAPYATGAKTSEGLKLSVKATDPSGVSAVWCSSSINKEASQGTLNADGNWECSVKLAAAGLAQINTWGCDGATPSNCGKDGAAPYLLTRTVLIDSTKPSIRFERVASYFDEKDIKLAMNGDVAKVPPEYQYASTTKTILDSAVEINKVASRLGWTTAPTAAVLEKDNPDNIPFLQYAIPYNPLTDAPIVSATYTVSINDKESSGNLWPSARTSETFLYYDLPLSSNLIPSLASITGAVQIKVTLSFADAAGNKIEVPEDRTFTFHVFGPPVTFVEDTGYRDSGDPKSWARYSIGNDTYKYLFDPGSGVFNPENKVRLIRYIISNPTNTPVALVPTLISANWSTTENWNGVLERLPGPASYSSTTTNYTIDGFTYNSRQAWGTRVYEQKGCITWHPCETPEWFEIDGGPGHYEYRYGYPIHWAGSNKQYECCNSNICKINFRDAPSNLVGHIEGQDVLSVDSYAFSKDSGDGVYALKLSDGQVIVSPAANMQPGTVVLYVARQRTTNPRSIALKRINTTQTTGPYESHIMDAWLRADSDVHDTECKYVQYGITFAGRVYYYDAWRWKRVLASAADVTSGTLNVATYGIRGDGTAIFGEPTTIASGLSVGRTFNY